MSNPDSIQLRNRILSVLGELPEFSGWLARRLAQLAITYGGGDGGPSPAIGDRMPPRPGMAQGIGWSVVLPSEADTVAVKESAARSRTPLAVAVDTDLPHAVLVRPDGHIALTAPAEEAAALPERLVTWLNRTPSPAH